ncbi:polyphosphate kinase [Aliikangiella marina]|uniref:Polyphosphate kinase n=1 Tax=Aliikangiella marina TaxID=1712262 RepID=A0A545T159_9GAMM|nr:polyphosphate kinase [Aliikangiella marina]TQV70955.1 polyphosphate kinase [Aliikangiella marina]
MNNNKMPSLNDVDQTLQFPSKQAYLSELKKWQLRMKQVQLAYYHQQRRALIVFEGWDAAGKGGAIRRITEKLDPRGFDVYPIGAPTAAEQGRHYLYRFVQKLPVPGTIAIFDRSYYGRVLVERVEKFAKKSEWKRAFQEINEWERALIDDGVRIVKLFIHITPEEQLERFEERLKNPLKRWKLTHEDIRNRDKWHKYENAINEMFFNTSTEIAPWTVIPGNKKWYARVQVLRTIVESLEYQVDVTMPPLDKTIIKAARKKLGIDCDGIQSK